MPEMQEQFLAMSMDGRYAGRSRPSMASTALGLLPGRNAGAISGDVHGWTVWASYSPITASMRSRRTTMRPCSRLVRITESGPMAVT